MGPARRTRSVSRRTNEKYTATAINNSTPVTLNPGIYTGITISGGANVTFNPGIYVFMGGGFSAS